MDDARRLRDLLEVIRENDLVESVAPIQTRHPLADSCRLALLELPEVPEMIGPFDEGRCFTHGATSTLELTSL